MVDADRLMGRAEIEQLLGVGYTRVRAIMSRPDFPPPIRQLTGMKIWDGAQVAEWIAVHRPPKLDEPTEGDS
jgi:predicted DNA-binding transcriptional regulator AlpA